MSRAFDPRTPVLVGAGQALNRDPGGDGAPEPLALALDALRAAARDSGAGEPLLRRADSVRCVATTGWLYPNQAALVAEAVGAQPRETVQTSRFGGDGPQRLIGDTARAIGAGELDVALLTGAEAIATVLACQRRGSPPPWQQPPERPEPSHTLGTDRVPANDAETAAGLLAPVYPYALIETALQARSGRDRSAQLELIAGLWSRFSEVAAANPHAWLPRSHTPDELATPSPENRPVSAPYLKLLTANIQVDLAAAVILCSSEAAERAGVPRDRWVFVWAGAHGTDEWHLSERAQLAASPAIRACGRAAFEHAGVTVDDVAYVDLYSCFPSAVQIAAGEFGLALDDPARPLTVTGGLTFAGGPGNNYSLHGVATLAERLREDPDAIGLATALGWYVTKHALGIYSARPPARPFRELAVEPALPAPRRIADGYEGPVTVEAYTVPHARDGSPEAGIISALTPDGARALVRTTEPELVDWLLADDPLGRELPVAARG